MGLNLLSISFVFGSSVLIVAGKIFYDTFDHKTKFKFDTVTDLRLKRKSHNDLKYKTKNNSTRTTKGI